MRRAITVFAVLLILASGMAAPLLAQESGGTLVGYVKDDTGGVLPGVTVTATSPAMLGTRTGATDAAGFYRLINLPPGDYLVTAEIQGFAAYRQPSVVMRAGVTFTQDIVMKLSSVAETVTVTGAAPMLEVGTPSHTLNISGEFQREVPIQARRTYADFLEMTTGVVTRPQDDNSGRVLYVGHGVDSWAYVVQIEGNSAINYQNAGAQNVGMSSELIADTNVKIAGIPASEPMGSGLVINIVTKSGGDKFSGAAAWAVQPMRWNGDNVPAGQSATSDSAGRGIPVKQKIDQPDLAFGGRVVRQKAWFFGAYRYQNNETAVGFSTQQVQQYKALVPGWQPFNSHSTGHQPYVKVTAQLDANHQVTGYWQYDRLESGYNRTIYYEPILLDAVGGSLFGGKLTDTWGSSTTTQFQATYNNKSGANLGTFLRLPGSGPQIDIDQSAFVSRGVLVGTGAFGTGGNVQSLGLAPSRMLIFRGDLTHYKEGWGGSHQLQAGFYAAPRLNTDTVTKYVNGGFTYEERALLDPNNLTGGTYAFHDRFVSPDTLNTIKARDRDIGFYVQDSWKPSERLTVNPGLRIDFVKRYDALLNITRMKDTPIGPRFSLTYLLTRDARNVLRFSAGRVHEQVNGRDYASGRTPGGRVQTTDKYYNQSGSLFAQIVTPALGPANTQYLFDPNLHQPYTDEYVGGFQKQFPGRVAIDASFVHRRISDVYALVDINGIYPGGPGLPFVGFGKVDPTQGIIQQQTNSTWAKYIYSGLEFTLSKQMSHNFQFLVGIHRQWQHQTGTWNPTDPARFIQPDAFPNDRGLWMTRGNYDQNSYENHGLGGAYTSTWRPYTVRTALTWLAPAGMTVAASWDVTSGSLSGTILTRIAASDPRFGPALIPIVGGSQPNPLATTNRFKYATRGEGQVQGPPVKLLNIKVGKKLRLGSTREVEVATNIFNVFNTGVSWLFNYYNGGEYDYSPNFLQPFNRANPRSANLFVAYRF